MEINIQTNKWGEGIGFTTLKLLLGTETGNRLKILWWEGGSQSRYN